MEKWWGRGSVEFRDASYEDFCFNCGKEIIMLPFMETYIWVHDDLEKDRDHPAWSTIDEHRRDERENTEIGGEG